MNVAGDREGFDRDASNEYDCRGCGAHIQHHKYLDRHEDWHRKIDSWPPA